MATAKLLALLILLCLKEGGNLESGNVYSPAQSACHLLSWQVLREVVF